MKQYVKFFLPLLLLMVSYAKAQTITGKIFDSTNHKAIPYAVVAILKPVDSILLKFTRTNKDGNFELKNIPADKYILMVTHPVYADIVDDITTTEGGLQLNTMKFIPKSQLLQEVIVKTGGPIKIKGDTISYTADSFKVSANANVEELLKKLPGIQVDKDGKIKAMGEQVQKVLVDGEEFFGDDPGMAVKNLRADAVKEVQVYDKKSEQAEFTGIDDGQKQKTINLKLKDDRKKGYFGKLDAAGGLQNDIDDRYNTNAMFNAFKGKRKISAFLLNGNTGQDGLNWQDNEKFGGDRDDVTMNMDEEGGMMWQSRGGSSDEEPNVNTENGFITNNNAGFHYSNKWDDKRTLTFSPKYNRQLYNNRQTTFTQRQFDKDSILNDNAVDSLDVNRYNFRNNLTYDVKFDSSNSLKVILKANFYHSESLQGTASETTGNEETIKNKAVRRYQQNSDKSSLSSSIIFRHKFKKPRRTFSVNADWNRLNTVAKNYLRSENLSYQDGLPSSILPQNQMIDIDKTTQKLTGKVVYTEPLNKNYSLELAYELIYSFGNNDQVINSYSALSNKYDDLVDSLTNHFKQLIVINKPSARISYNFKKFKFSFGSGFGITKFDFRDISINQESKRSYTNLFPAANLTYTYKPNHSVNFSYNGNTTQPTITQLQPLMNTVDNYNEYEGNPYLRPSFTHSINVSHNSYNFIKDLWTYQSFNIRSTLNPITNSSTVSLQDGKTHIKPINTNDNISMSFWGGVGFKLKKLNMNINFQPNFNYTSFTDVINEQIALSKTFNGGIGVWLNKSKEKKYDFSLGNTFSYNSNRSSLNNTVNSYYTNTVNLNATVYYKKVWSIITDYNFFARQKTEQFKDNLTNNLWNASLQKTFKDNEFTAYVTIRDILNDNIGVERSYYGTTTTEITNQRLQRYWMIGFTWNFKNKGNAPAAPATP